MSKSTLIYIAHKRKTSNALYALVRSEHKRFQMLSEICLCQHQNRASSLAKNSTLTDQPQRKPVGRWCLAGNVERLEVIGWQIGVVAVMRRWMSDGRNPSGTVGPVRACSCTLHSAKQLSCCCMEPLKLE